MRGQGYTELQNTLRGLRGQLEDLEMNIGIRARNDIAEMINRIEMRDGIQDRRWRNPSMHSHWQDRALKWAQDAFEHRMRKERASQFAKLRGKIERIRRMLPPALRGPDEQVRVDGMSDLERRAHDILATIFVVLRDTPPEGLRKTDVDRFFLRRHEALLDVLLQELKKAEGARQLQRTPTHPLIVPFDSKKAVYRALVGANPLWGWASEDALAFVTELRKVLTQPVVVDILENIGSGWVLWERVKIEPSSGTPRPRAEWTGYAVAPESLDLPTTVTLARDAKHPFIRTVRMPVDTMREQEAAYHAQKYAGLYELANKPVVIDSIRSPELEARLRRERGQRTERLVEPDDNTDYIIVCHAENTSGRHPLFRGASTRPGGGYSTRAEAEQRIRMLQRHYSRAGHDLGTLQVVKRRHGCRACVEAGWSWMPEIVPGKPDAVTLQYLRQGSVRRTRRSAA